MINLPEIRQVVNIAYDPSKLGIFITQLGGISGPAAIALAGVAALAAGIGAVVGVCVEAVKATMDWGNSLYDVSLKLGVTTEYAAGLRLVCDGVGISVDFLTNRMLMFEKGLETGTGKIGTTAHELDKLGISYKNADGTFKTSAELLQSVADWFVTCTNVTDRNNAEMLIFGRNGSDLDDLLTHIAGHGMADFIQKAKDMGLALSPAQVEAVKNLSFNFNLLKDSFQGLGVTLGFEFVPFLTTIVNLATSIVLQFSNWKTQIHDILQLVGLVGPTPKTPSAPTQAGNAANPTGLYTGGQTPFDKAMRNYWNHGNDPALDPRLHPYDDNGNIVPEGGGGAAPEPELGKSSREGGGATKAGSGLTPAMQLVYNILNDPIVKTVIGMVQNFFSNIGNAFSQIHWDTLGPALDKLKPLFEAIGLLLGAVAVWIGGLAVGIAIDDIITGINLAIDVFSILGSLFDAIVGIYVGITTGDWSRLGSDIADVLIGFAQIITDIVNGVIGEINVIITIIDSYGGKLKKIDPVTVREVMGVGAPVGKKEGYAAGGYLGPWFNIVGENGYELIDPYGYVYNHTISEKLMGGSGAGGGGSTPSSPGPSRMDISDRSINQMARAMRDAVLQGVQ